MSRAGRSPKQAKSRAAVPEPEPDRGRVRADRKSFRPIIKFVYAGGCPFVTPSKVTERGDNMGHSINLFRKTPQR